MKKAAILGLLSILFLFSCSTVKKFSFQDYMHIMVYDQDGNMLQGVKFSLDGKTLGESDVYGRFIVSIPANHDDKTHTLKGTKAGYAPIEEKIKYKNSDVLYFRIGNVDQYLERAETALDENRFDDALAEIEKAEKIESADDILYLKAIILKKLGRNDDAIKILKSVKIKNEKLLMEIEKQ